MATVIIVFGAGLVLFYLINYVRASKSYNKPIAKPLPSSSKYLFAVFGVACFIISLDLFYNISQAARYDTWNAVTYVVFCIFFGIVGFQSIKAAYNADEKHAQNMAARAAAKAAHDSHQISQIALEGQRRKAEEEAHINAIRRDTEAAQLATIKREAELRGELANQSYGVGLTVDTYDETNAYAFKKGIDLKNIIAEKTLDHNLKRDDKTHDVNLRGQELKQDFDAADMLILADRQAEKKLNEDLAQLRRERYQIASGDDPEELKRDLLSDKDGEIDSVKARIDAAKTRHVLSGNRNDTKRLQEPAPESRKSGLAKNLDLKEY